MLSSVHRNVPSFPPLIGLSGLVTAKRVDQQAPAIGCANDYTDLTSGEVANRVTVASF